MSPAAREFLSALALGQGPDGLQKVLALLTPIEAADYSKNPGFGAMVLDRLGTTYYLLKQCEKAVPAFEKAVALTPRNDAVLNNFAYLCVDCLKDAKKALPAARMAVQLQPTRGEYLDTLAYALLADGQGAAALEAADRAAKLGDSAAIQLHRAQAFKLLDRLPQARETANRALGMQPDDATKTSIEQLLSSLK
jgi:tetratricopeptide (TPR) repeat protein